MLKGKLQGWHRETLSRGKREMRPVWNHCTKLVKVKRVMSKVVKMCQTNTDKFNGGNLHSVIKLIADFDAQTHNNKLTRTGIAVKKGRMKNFAKIVRCSKGNQVVAYIEYTEKDSLYHLCTMVGYPTPDDNHRVVETGTLEEMEDLLAAFDVQQADAELSYFEASRKRLAVIMNRSRMHDYNNFRRIVPAMLLTFAALCMIDAHLWPAVAATIVAVDAAD